MDSGAAKVFQSIGVTRLKGGFAGGFELWALGIVPEQFPSVSSGGSMVYRYEAASENAFVQQLAVAYVNHGYWYYVAGVIPPDKDVKLVDDKLMEKYGIGISKWRRARRKGGKKHQKGGQERGVFEGEKAPEKGPPQLTDVWCLEMVPDAGVRRDVDGGAL